mgnify:CR=1 FL=1|jgi:predicted phosphoribosyltransferase|tara:strand:- start:1237 stop:1920 length:684 start_codon:yes stop_codon:yes gene_type:complete
MKLIEYSHFRNRTHVFDNREHAGQILSKALNVYKELDPIVFAVPLGGIPVSAKISKILNCPMHTTLVSRLPLPHRPLVGFGAVSITNEVVINKKLVETINLKKEIISEVIENTKKKLKKMHSLFGEIPPINIKNKRILLVDDGINSGYTLLAAIKSIKRNSPKEIIIAVPTASEKGIKLLESEIETFVCPNVRTGYFFSVLNAYKNWRELEEMDIIKYFDHHHRGKK